MLSRIFPKRIDNNYHGYHPAAWLLLLLLLGRTAAAVHAIGLNSLWTSRDVLQGVEGIPLDTFGATAVDAAILLFARWGVTHLVLTLLGFVALVRYRAMIPLIYLLLALDHIGMHEFAELTSIGRADGSSAPMPFVGIAVTLIGFGMSLTTRRPSEVAPEPPHARD